MAELNEHELIVTQKLKEIGTAIGFSANRGGCAIIAYSIVEFSKTLGVNASVVYFFNEYSLTDYNNLRNNAGNGSCSHAVVYLSFNSLILG